jgi:hypothetical protein
MAAPEIIPAASVPAARQQQRAGVVGVARLVPAYGTIGSLVVYVVAVFLGPETKGKVMTADLEVIEVEVPA